MFDIVSCCQRRGNVPTGDTGRAGERECAVGSSRYDRDRPVGEVEAGEARALHTVAELVAALPTFSIDRAVAAQISEVLHAAAIELAGGRPLPLNLRRAVRGLANALRTAMDPRTPTSPSKPSTTSAS
jgi:hypothetical protein